MLRRTSSGNGAREIDQPYQKALYEANKSSRGSRIGLRDVNGITERKRESRPNNAIKTLHLQNAAEDIWVQCEKMAEQLELTAENSMYRYKRFPIRRRAGLNQERVFVTSTPLTMEEVTWITMHGPASRINDTLDSTFDATFNAVGDEESNEVTITASEFENELSEGSKTIELCGAAGTALTEIAPAAPKSDRQHRKGKSTGRDQGSSPVEESIREADEAIPKKLVNKIMFPKLQNSTSSSISSASSNRTMTEGEKAAKKEAAANARTQRKKKVDANRKEKNRVTALKMEKMAREISDLKAAAERGGEGSGSPGASPARQPLSTPLPQRTLAPPFRKSTGGGEEEADEQFALPPPTDARRNRQTQAMVTPRQPKVAPADASSKFKFGRPQEIVSVERQDKAGEGKSDELVGIKDLKSLRPNPLKELASDYKRKVEGSIAEMSLKHRLHRDSLKTIENQMDVLFAEKRRLERIEKGEGEPQNKR